MQWFLISVRSVVIVLGLVCALGVSTIAVAQTSGASQFIRNLGEEAIKVLASRDTALDAREARFRSLLANGFDLDFISRFVLGRFWRGASPEQRSSYQQLFTKYVLRVYSSRFGGYAGETLNIVAERVAGKRDVMITTQIDRPSGPPIRADWRVRKKNGTYRIIDVMVERVSMAATQRSEFASVIKRNGIDGLIHLLDVRTSKVSATTAAR
jgi:phospholipid transport system substrate-binding protein